MSSETQIRTMRHWDSQVKKEDATWTSNRYIISRVFERISGNSNKWWLNWLLEDHFNRRFARALSLGCGSAGHEIIMLRTGLVEHIDAFDISPESIKLAKEAANKEGFTDQLNLRVASFEEFIDTDVEIKYDLISFFGALHHVLPIETVLIKCKKILKDDGKLIFNEYTGPCYAIPENRTRKIIQMLYSCVHPEFMTTNLQTFPFLSFEQKFEYDPSEATRSALILPLLGEIFEIESLFPFGGGILHLLYPMLRHDVMDSEAPAASTIMRMLLSFEEILMEHKIVPSDFHVGVCRLRPPAVAGAPV